jgi:N6-adenosine-specific RNA methylase IME4
MAVEWLQGCEVCNAGLCVRFDELMSEGKSQRSAAKILENEQKRTLGEVIYPASALRNRYANNKLKTKKVVENLPKKETCATPDLQSLIDAGKKFSTIYADPPWQYSNQGTRAATNNHYDTMSIDDIAALPIASLVADHAHLHLWTTNAFLFDAKGIMEAWGFQYKSCFIWVKPQMGIGNYWRVSHEFMLLGVRGSCPFMDRSQMSWAAIDRTKHSAKPEVVAQKIEKTSPGPYLELFGRQTREGWTVWGNEIEKTLFNDAAFADSI